MRRTGSASKQLQDSTQTFNELSRLNVGASESPEARGVADTRGVGTHAWLCSTDLSDVWSTGKTGVRRGRVKAFLRTWAWEGSRSGLDKRPRGPPRTCSCGKQESRAVWVGVANLVAPQGRIQDPLYLEEGNRRKKPSVPASRSPSRLRT